MKTFYVEGRTISAYLAEPEHRSGPGVLVLHAWWGLTQPFRQVCDRLAQDGFVALAPDLYHGKTTGAVEEAEALVAALNQDEERVCSDIEGAVQGLRQHVVTPVVGGRGKLAVVGFSLGGAYALDLSVKEAEEIAEAVTFYCAPTPDWNIAEHRVVYSWLAEALRVREPTHGSAVQDKE